MTIVWGHKILSIYFAGTLSQSEIWLTGDHAWWCTGSQTSLMSGGRGNLDFNGWKINWDEKQDHHYSVVIHRRCFFQKNFPDGSEYNARKKDGDTKKQQDHGPLLFQCLLNVSSVGPVSHKFSVTKSQHRFNADLFWCSCGNLAPCLSKRTNQCAF